VLGVAGHDVADGLAATADGLYDLSACGERAPRRLLDGPFAVVAGPGGTGRGDHGGALAASGDGRLYERGSEDWRPVEHPVDAPVGICRADGGAPVLVTVDGTVAVGDGNGGWRSRALGLPDVRAVAVP
jgi:hypothetical protein